MDNLGWRGRTPTAYTFLHLYCYGLASVPAATICVASYIAVCAGSSRGCIVQLTSPSCGVVN